MFSSVWREFRRSLVLFALVVATGCLASAGAKAQSAPAYTASVTVTNGASVARTLKELEVTGEDADGNPTTEVLQFENGIPIPPGKSVTIETSTICCCTVESWKPTWGATYKVEKSYTATSVQVLDGDPMTVWSYSLMFAADADLFYHMSADDLEYILPVDEGDVIYVEQGIDLTGHFPPTVEFFDLNTAIPYTGILESGGSMKIKEGGRMRKPLQAKQP